MLDYQYDSKAKAFKQGFLDICRLEAVYVLRPLCWSLLMPRG